MNFRRIYENISLREGTQNVITMAKAYLDSPEVEGITKSYNYEDFKKWAIENYPNMKERGYSNSIFNICLIRVIMDHPDAENLHKFSKLIHTPELVQVAKEWKNTGKMPAMGTFYLPGTSSTKRSESSTSVSVTTEQEIVKEIVERLQSKEGYIKGLKGYETFKDIVISPSPEEMPFFIEILEKQIPAYINDIRTKASEKGLDPNFYTSQYIKETVKAQDAILTRAIKQFSKEIVEKIENLKKQQAERDSLLDEIE